MKKIVIFFIFSFCYLFSAAITRADLIKTQNDYNTALDVYRAADKDYQSARSAYLTYKTLNAQNEALNKTKAFLEARINVLNAYYFLLRERLALAPGIDEYDKNLTRDALNNRIAFFQDHKIQIPSIASLEDADKKSEAIDGKITEIQNEASKIIGKILIGKVKDQSDKLTESLALLSVYTNQIKSSGADVSKLERWIIDTGYKRDLANGKLNEAQAVFDRLDVDYGYSRESNFTKGKNLVTEGNQYLKEAVFNAKEAVKEILTGPY